MQPITTDHNGYTITTDKSLMSVTDIHKWLSEEAYWCRNIPLATVQTAFDNSFCIAALLDGRQVAFGRLITDYAVFGYLADVFVMEPHRGKGISKQMMQLLFDLDWVKQLRGVKLATRDAHGLYKQFGFVACQNPARIMEIAREGIYERDLK